MEQSGLSCLSVVHGFSEMLEESIQSFLMQEWNQRELVIFNTNSEHMLILSDPHVKIVNCLNRLQPLDIIKQVAQAVTRGDWIVLWDAASVYYPEYLTLLAASIDPSIDWLRVGGLLAYRCGRLEHLNSVSDHSHIAFRKSCIEQVFATSPDSATKSIGDVYRLPGKHVRSSKPLILVADAARTVQSNCGTNASDPHDSSQFTESPSCRIVELHPQWRRAYEELRAGGSGDDAASTCATGHEDPRNTKDAASAAESPTPVRPTCDPSQMTDAVIDPAQHSATIFRSSHESAIAQVRRRSLILCCTQHSPSIRVLLFTASKGRPFMLLSSIAQVQTQSHPCDHSVFVNTHGNDSSGDYLDLVERSWIASYVGRLWISSGPSASAHANHCTAIRAVTVDDYDLFLKVDDDDVYPQDYVRSVVESFERERWAVSAEHSCGIIARTKWHPQIHLKSLGQGEEDRRLKIPEFMPSTLAFSRPAIDVILSLRDFGGYEDIGWRRRLAECGFQIALRPPSGFVYHFHGHNSSTASWINSRDELVGDSG